MAGPGAPSPRGGSRPTGDASEIADGVFVGGWADAEGFEGIRICVVEELPTGPIPAEALLPVYDREHETPHWANLDRLVELAGEARARGDRVLFFCGHGLRRGALAGAWYLHRREGVPVAVAFDRVQAVRPRIERPRHWMGDPGELASA